MIFKNLTVFSFKKRTETQLNDISFLLGKLDTSIKFLKEMSTKNEKDIKEIYKLIEKSNRKNQEYFKKSR